jgi:hypothetical protein
MTADKGETDAEFEQKFFDVFKQSAFEVAFVRFRAEREKIENIRVF